MMDYLAGLNFLEKIYLMCAILGGAFFVLRTVLMLAGMGDHSSDTDGGGGDFDHDFDHGDSGDHVDHVDHDAGLRLLTLQGLTAFIMMFGATGFAFSRGSFLNNVMTFIIGAAVGLFAMWLVAKGFALMRSLQCTGTMRISDAIGEEASVYLTIPADGIGKIQVVISGRLMVVDAVSQDKVQLKTGARVCVSEVTSGGMLSVRGI